MPSLISLCEISRPIQKLDTAIARAICEALDVALEDLIRFAFVEP